MILGKSVIRDDGIIIGKMQPKNTFNLQNQDQIHNNNDYFKYTPSFIPKANFITGNMICNRAGITGILTNNPINNSITGTKK